MRLKIATFLLMAGTVVGCASNPPPPPPPMAMAPEPAPAPPPVAMGPMDGMYKGRAELAADAPRSCRKMGATTARVRSGVITMAGMRGKIGPDGTITSMGRGPSMTGTVSNGTADITTMRGPCSYHYTLTHA